MEVTKEQFKEMRKKGLIVTQREYLNFEHEIKNGLIISRQEYEILLNKKMREKGLTKKEASQELKEELKIIKKNERAK